MSDPRFKNIGSPSIKVIEECSELIKAVCKAERFGYLNHHPDRPTRTNRDEIRSEMEDVVEAFEVLEKTMRHIGFTLEKYEEESKRLSGSSA